MPPRSRRQLYFRRFSIRINTDSRPILVAYLALSIPNCQAGKLTQSAAMSVTKDSCLLSWEIGQNPLTLMSTEPIGFSQPDRHIKSTIQIMNCCPLAERARGASAASTRNDIAEFAFPECEQTLILCWTLICGDCITRDPIFSAEADST